MVMMADCGAKHLRRLCNQACLRPGIHAISQSMNAACERHAIKLAQELAAHLLLGLSRALDLRRSRVWRMGSEPSREQLGELPRGREVNVCRLCELVGESVTCRQNKHCHWTA